MANLTTEYGTLVGVDGSTASDAAVRFAAREAALYGTPLTLLHVVAPVPSWATSVEQAKIAAAWEANAHDVIEQARKIAQAAADDSVLPDIRSEVTWSAVAPTLIEASSRARIVVVGSNGMGAVARLVLGSVTDAMLHRARCPVAIIHDIDDPADADAPVLVGLDGSPASEGALQLAFDEASRRKVQLVALHAWSDVGVFPILGMDWRDYETKGAQLLDRHLAHWQPQFPDVGVRRRLVCDKPAAWLIEESERAQLVVLGSHGRGSGLPGMALGSVSSALSHATKTPLIIHRTEGVNR
jgi:nucleotide-binding universal stress UspA family protein